MDVTTIVRHKLCARRKHRYTPARLEEFAAAIQEIGTFDRAIGFIDGTFMHTNRPGSDDGEPVGRGLLQRAFYNGATTMYCSIAE